MASSFEVVLMEEVSYGRGTALRDPRLIRRFPSVPQARLHVVAL